jgi:Ca-activated chloride channel family protein
MSWGAPELLLGLWAMPVLGLLLMWSLRRRGRAMARLGPLIGADVGRRAHSRHRSRMWLIWLGLGLLLTALAQPRWGYRWEELEREGLSVVVVLDTSASMAAQDVSPSRMERAQREVLDLSDALSGDRVGLVIFAGGAYKRLPLTLDYGSLRTVVKRTTMGTLKSQGSDIGAALESAGELLGAASAADRVILLISDGEDQVGRAQEVAAKLAEDGVHIYAMGIGTPDGAPIPNASGGFKKDRGGDLVLSRLDEATLKSIASAGKGAYVRSVAGTADTRAIYQEEILTKLSRANQGVSREKIWDERFQWPLGLGLGLLILGLWVRGPRPKVGPALGLGLMLLLVPPVHGDEGKVSGLLAEQVAQPGNLQVAEDLGAALFEAGRFNQAEAVLSSVADRALDSALRDRARYNAGLSAYQAGRLSEAAEDWQRLLQDGEHPAAQKNLDAVNKEIAARQGQEPPEQEQDQSGEQGDEGEQSGEPQTGQDTGAPQPPQEPPSEPQEEQPGDGDEPQPPQDEASKPPESKDTGESPEPVGERGEISEEEGGESEEQAEADEVQPLGSISAQEAKRLFDGVEEGTPRVSIDPGSAGGNDW